MPVRARSTYTASRRAVGLVPFPNDYLGAYVTLRGGMEQFMEPQLQLDGAHASYADGL